MKPDRVINHFCSLKALARHATSRRRHFRVYFSIPKRPIKFPSSEAPEFPLNKRENKKYSMERRGARWWFELRRTELENVSIPDLRTENFPSEREPESHGSRGKHFREPLCDTREGRHTYVIGIELFCANDKLYSAAIFLGNMFFDIR